MADKKVQELNNTRTSVVAGDIIAIGGADGFTYKANLNILQGFLLENSLTTSTIKAPQSTVVKAAIDAINTILTTDNASFDDFQKITDAIEAIQSTLTVDDANYNTLQKIVDKLKAAETKLATIAAGAEVNAQADWDETDNTSDAFINNKPALGTASSKDVGTAVGNVQENGAVLANLQTLETDATGKFITAAKNTAYNANFGTGNTDVARGDASYLKSDTEKRIRVSSISRFLPRASWIMQLEISKELIDVASLRTRKEWRPEPHPTSTIRNLDFFSTLSSLTVFSMISSSKAIAACVAKLSFPYSAS